jgi:hypothetical protein
VALDKTVVQPHLETPVGIASVEEQPSRFMPGLVIVGDIKDFDAHDSLSSVNHVATVLRHAFLRPASYQAGVHAALFWGSAEAESVQCQRITLSGACEHRLIGASEHRLRRRAPSSPAGC